MTNGPLVFCVANQKGGVGKTTSSVNLAASLAVSERKTLLIDMDPQGNASSAFGIVTPPTQIYDALVAGEPLEALLYRTELDFLQVIPSGKDLVGAEIELVDRPRRERQLANRISELREGSSGYEFVIIDCPPSLGLLTLNALVAADRLLVPLQAEYYALEGLAHLMDTIERIRGAFNPNLELEGVLLTMFDGRNNLGRQVAAEVRAHFGKRVFETVIPRNVRLSEAPSFGKPALLYDARSPGAQAYLHAAAEILARYPATPAPEERPAPQPSAQPGASSNASKDASSDASCVASQNASSQPTRRASTPPPLSSPTKAPHPGPGRTPRP